VIGVYSNIELDQHVTEVCYLGKSVPEVALFGLDNLMKT